MFLDRLEPKKGNTHTSSIAPRIATIQPYQLLPVSENGSTAPLRVRE
jgi:hypothetical protein